MAILSKQVGYSTEANLLYEILKRLKNLNCGGGSSSSCCHECNYWYNGEVEGSSLTIPASLIHSITIITESGQVVVSNGSSTATYTEGMSVTFTASNLLIQAMTIDATIGHAIVAIIACADVSPFGTTTTTTLPPTTTTTTTTEELTTTTTTEFPN